MDYIIREFKLNDRHEAELLAEMWNASDEGWPGGFTRGITDTADRVLARKGQMNTNFDTTRLAMRTNPLMRR